MCATVGLEPQSIKTAVKNFDLGPVRYQGGSTYLSRIEMRHKHFTVKQVDFIDHTQTEREREREKEKKE